MRLSDNRPATPFLLHDVQGYTVELLQSIALQHSISIATVDYPAIFQDESFFEDRQNFFDVMGDIDQSRYFYLTGDSAKRR